MINHLDLQGRMVADPEVKQTNSGSSVVNFRIAWSEKYKDRENKLFIECKAFGAQADLIGKFFRKGQELCVEGKLNTEEWETQDGQKRSKIVLMVNGIHFCGKKEDGGNVQPNLSPVVDNGELPF